MPVPDWYDAVVMLEDSRLRGSKLEVTTQLHPFKNVSRTGEDIAAGEKIFSQGHTLRPPDLSLLSALGIENVEVYAKPEVAITLLQALARRLRRTNDTLADMVFTDVPGRVAKALLDLSRRFGRQTEGGVLVAHELTQEELAQLVGASRETVNKALADFASRGWIRLEARAVALLDIERLTRRAR